MSLTSHNNLGDEFCCRVAIVTNSEILGGALRRLKAIANPSLHHTIIQIRVKLLTLGVCPQPRTCEPHHRTRSNCIQNWTVRELSSIACSRKELLSWLANGLITVKISHTFSLREVSYRHSAIFKWMNIRFLHYILLTVTLAAKNFLFHIALVKL